MSKRNQGIMLAIIGTMFWGISSPFAQALFAQNVKPLWLVGARLLLAGILLSVWGFIATDKEQHKEIFKKKNLILLILFAVFGMVPSQLTFFLAIRYGNASTATILQFLGPVFIIVCLAIQYRKLPPRIDVILRYWERFLSLRTEKSARWHYLLRAFFGESWQASVKLPIL